MHRITRSVAVSAAGSLPPTVRRALAKIPGVSAAYVRMLAGPGLVSGRVREGPLAGARILYRPRSENQYSDGDYELHTQRVIADLPLTDAVAWDVGAHIGFFSLLLARRCRMVVAVEPTPASARRLRANASLNDAPIQVVQAAVGRESGTAYLSLAADGRMNRVHRDAEGLNVRITTLDDLAQLLGFPDLVKLDVEGAELDALLGAKTVLAHHPTVLVEAHSPDLLAAVTELLQVNGYDVQRTAAPVEPFVPTMLVATRSRPT